jgi:hypothetical protein
MNNLNDAISAVRPKNNEERKKMDRQNAPTTVQICFLCHKPRICYPSPAVLFHTLQQKLTFFAALTFSLQSQEPRDTHAMDSSLPTLWIKAHASKIYFSSYVTISI